MFSQTFSFSSSAVQDVVHISCSSFALFCVCFPLPYSLSYPGLYAGIKFFIIDFLFKSCPKLRDKYDTPYIVWNSLPTDPQLKERTNATVSRRVRKEKTHTYTHLYQLFAVPPPSLLPLTGSCSLKHKHTNKPFNTA